MPVNINKALEYLDVDKNAVNYKLLQIPKFDAKDTAKYKTFQPGYVQADLQFWNTDEGYNYLLVVVDIQTKRIDFEPMKDKSQETVIKSMENIFSRTYIYDHDKTKIVLPNIIMTDAGSEFSGKFIEWCTKHNIQKKTGRAGRKQQTSVVEGFNLVISKVLAIKSTMVQANEKLKGKHTQRRWVRYLPKLRIALNDNEVSDTLISSFFQFAKVFPNQILRIGDKVHVILEKPLDVNDNKLSGKFRTGDYRYEKTARVITNRIYNLSGNPIRYVVSGHPNATFARSELMKRD
jgi:hypothetical protein